MVKLKWIWPYGLKSEFKSLSSSSNVSAYLYKFLLAKVTEIDADVGLLVTMVMTEQGDLWSNLLIENPL